MRERETIEKRLSIERERERNGFVNYLKMKMKRTSKAKKTATLSIVRNMTTNWRRRLGMKRTSFRMRKRRNVRKTDRPEPPSLSPPIRL